MQRMSRRTTIIIIAAAFVSVSASVTATLVFYTGMQAAYADATYERYSPHEDVGIIISPACRELSLIGDPTCPRYADLLELDGTIPWISGDMVWTGHDYMREHPSKHNGMRYYDYHSGMVMMLDPPGDYLRELRLILIVPNVPKYVTDTTSPIYHSLRIDQCKMITVDASLVKYGGPTYVHLLAAYMNLGCPFDLMLAYQHPRY